MKKSFSLYWKLFTSTFLLSAFTFGGGYVIVSLMKKKFVDELQWIDEKDILDLTAIAQSCPGPVAVNASILIGRKIAGLKGSLVAMLSTILPPLIVLSVISLFYNSFKDNLVIQAMLKGMQAGIAAVIINVVLSMASKLVKEKKVFSIIITVAVFALLFFLDINVIYIIAACIALGVAIFLLNRRKEVKGQ